MHQVRTAATGSVEHCLCSARAVRGHFGIKEQQGEEKTITKPPQHYSVAGVRTTTPCSNSLRHDSSTRPHSASTAHLPAGKREITSSALQLGEGLHDTRL